MVGNLACHHYSKSFHDIVAFFKNMKKKSAAKINLFLHIVGKRPNGYHNLQSICVKLNKLFDTIEILESSMVECHMLGLQQEKNIVYKVAIALREKFAVKAGAKIEICKKIPLGAGLGGGSSNAGTALQMLKRFWKLNISDFDLAMFAANYGADIPFFVYPYNQAIVEGIGELITPCKLNKKLYVLLVNPGIHVDTASIFKKGFLTFAPETQFQNQDLWQLTMKSYNDLESNAQLMHSEIADLLAAIQEMQGCILSRMSGSGSTCFGFFEIKNDLLNAAKYFAKTWWVHYEEIDI